MKLTLPSFIMMMLLVAAALPGQETEPISRILKDRTERGTLADRSEKVRGDSGKWRDLARLQVSPAISAAPEKLSLDDWADALDPKNFRLTSNRNTWLIFRTQQLDDNDRLWVEKIERKGTQITIVLNHAVWQGDYSKNFTWYSVLGVNLGKLPPGDYEAKWIVKPLSFLQFENPSDRRASWPKDEHAAQGAEAGELTTTFAVSDGR